MITSVDSEKSLTTSNPLHDTRVRKSRVRIKEKFLNIIKAVYSKPIANIKLNGEKPKAATLKLGTR